MEHDGPRMDSIRYGTDVPTESELRLLPDLSGKRVLELGSGSRSSGLAMARRGAHVIVVDPHPQRLEETKTLAEEAEIRAEWHEADLEGLAFLRGDSIDVAFSCGTVVEVPDLGRLFRQVHRVLKAGASFVFSYDHPALLIAQGRSYWDETPIPTEVDGVTVEQHPHPISEVFMALHRAGYRADHIAEPVPGASDATLPSTLIWRARKEGV